MSKILWALALAAFLLPEGAASAPLIAMRVDVEAVTTSGAGTGVVIAVEIAPEDRARLGRRALVQVELRRGGAMVDRAAETAEVADDGTVRLEATWPPGVYELRVDVEGSATGSSGFWVGTITIPRLTQEPLPTPRPIPAPAEPAGAPPVGVVEAVAPTPPAEPVRRPPASPLGEDVTEWGSSEPAFADLTVVVTERNRPILGLEREDLVVRVDGVETAIESFGDATTAPLYLAVAVDVSRSMAKHLPEVSRQLGKLALGTLNHGGRLALVAADAQAVTVLGWDEGSPAGLAEALTEAGSTSEGDLASLVTTSLAAFTGRRGRRFLLVITDGGDTAGPVQWKEAAAAADAAGVPVLVVGLDSESMSGRLRRSLQQLAVGTGGRSYFLNSRSVLPLTLSYMAELINGSYALQVRVGSRSELHKVRVAVPGSGDEVYFPRQVR